MFSELLAKVDKSLAFQLQALYLKVESVYGEQMSFQFCSHLLKNQELLYKFLWIEDDILYAEVGKVLASSMSNEKEETQKIKMKDTIKSNNKSSILNKQSQTDLKRKAIYNNPEQEKRLGDLMKKIKLNSDGDYDSKKNQQQIDPYDYIQTLKQNLKRDKQFSSKFSDEDFQNFLGFYVDYSELKLISQKDIKNNAKKISNKTDEKLLLNQMILVDSALFYTSPQHRLRITQILALYCILVKSQIPKILLQILTGQGKSTMIACLAAILNIRGQQVDIITTNKILAKRDSEENEPFFRLLNIKVDHNISPQNKGNEPSLSPRKCYQKGTVVYGTPFCYQVDLLFDQYKKKKTRNGRPYDVAIIDEVDSMFIDEKANQTLLSTTYGGFSQLVHPMRCLWTTIVSHNLVQEGQKLILYKDGKQKGQIIKGEVNQVMRLIIQQLKIKFQNQIIPKWREQFIDFSLKDWIWSAVQAAHVYKQNHHYVIEKEKIVPVDYRNTGCLQKNVQWQHGLHQFLQIKHGLQVTTESMTSNFMSNIGHFSRYKSIFGVTGTLGSIQSKKFLQKTYQAQMLQIPPYRKRRLQIIPGHFMYSEGEWLQRIVMNIEKKMKQKRSVLIICKTIQHGKVIYEAIKRRNINFKIIRCHFTGQQNHTDKVVCLQIRIATNVAGRGTDLKASQELISQGGLHVIIGFMPENLRVQMQARGRAGRNGAPGSSQLIVNHSEYFNDYNIPLIKRQQFINQNLQNNISLITQKIRDSQQAQSMKNDLQKVQQLKIKDRIFEYFCKVVGTIPDYQQNKAKRDSLEEAWAMFLKKADYFKLTNEQRQFQAKRLVDSFAVNSENFYNPSHTVWRAINQINNNNLDKAKGYFQQLQVKDMNLTNRIAGKIMQSAITIKQDDKKKKTNYPSSIENWLSSLPLLEDRKQIVKAEHAMTVSSNNQSIVNLMQQQSSRLQARMLQSLSPNASQANNKAKQINFIRNGDLQPLQKRNIEQLMNIPQVNMLNSIRDHIKNQVNIIRNIKPNQYADICFKPLSQILDTSDNKEENKEAIDKLTTDIPYLPVTEVKKIKVPWWKRALVFALGVLQICVGALIVSASSGAAASFGSFMMQSGFKDCFAAIFTPQVCRDLDKFYNQKTIEYTLALMTCGFEGMSQLSKLAKNGFETIKNSTMSQVMKKATEQISKGLVKGGFDWKGIVQKQIFQGISSRLMNDNGMIKGKPGQSIKAIMQQPDMKKYIQEGFKEQEKLEFKGKQLQEKFQKDTLTEIKKIIDRQYAGFLDELNNSKFQPEHVRIVIENAFDQSFGSHFGGADKDKTYKQIIYYIAQNMNNKDLAKILIKDFQIQSLVEKTIKQVSKSKNYQICIKNSQIQMRNNLIDVFNQVSSKYQKQCNTMFDKLKTQQQRINKSALTVQQRNLQVNQYNKQVQTYKQKQKLFNDYVQQFKQMDQDGQIVKFLIAMGVIENGRFIKNFNQIQHLHQYSVQALRNMKDTGSSEGEFKTYLQTAAYNSYGSVVFKAFKQLIDNSSNSVSRLKNIQQKLFKQIQGKK